MSTKYIAAYALCSLRGTPSKEDVSKVLESVGITIDEATLDFTFEAVGTKSMAELVAAGNATLARNISLGGVATAAAPAASIFGCRCCLEWCKNDTKKPLDEEDDDFGMGGLF